MYLFRNVVEDVRFQRHLHVHGAGDPAELALPHVEHSLDLSGCLSGYLDGT